MKIVVATTHALFIRGGAEYLADGLKKALIDAGHTVEIAAIPFRAAPAESIPQQMLLNRLIDISEGAGGNIDLMVGLKFPAYLIPHPNKVLWLCHQHRGAYDLWDSEIDGLSFEPEGQQIRDFIRCADLECISEAKTVFTISKNVSDRLVEYCGIESTPIYNPPRGEEHFYSEEPQQYFLFPSRINRLKRQDLALEALAMTKNPVQLHFAGVPDHSDYYEELCNKVNELQLTARVKWLGMLPELYTSYAACLGVVFIPVDEDYGYVTLEAMLSSKPVITCNDSGGTLEFVKSEETGLCVKPTAEALASAMDSLWENRSTAIQYGRAGRERYQSLNITWQNVVAQLLR